MRNARKKCAALDLWALPVGRWPWVNSSTMNQTQEHSCIVFGTLALTSFPSMDILHPFLIPSRLVTDQVAGPLAGSLDYHILSATVFWTIEMLSVIFTTHSEYFNMSYYPSQDYNSILVPLFWASSILDQYLLACLLLLPWGSIPTPVKSLSFLFLSISTSQDYYLLLNNVHITMRAGGGGHHNLDVFYSTNP